MRVCILCVCVCSVRANKFVRDTFVCRKLSNSYLNSLVWFGFGFMRLVDRVVCKSLSLHKVSEFKSIGALVV